MHLELPERLHSTRDLLMRSLPVHPLEKAPAMPADLADDLMASLGPKAAVVRRVVATTPLLERIRAFLATPAFGLAATAVVVLGLAVPRISERGPHETFRGAESTAVTGGSITIVFVGTNRALQSSVENSGNFEPSAFRSAVDLASAQEVMGAKVVIDFNTGKIHAVDSAGVEVHSTRIPAKTDKVAGAVAEAVSHL